MNSKHFVAVATAQEIRTLEFRSSLSLTRVQDGNDRAPPEDLMGLRQTLG